MRFVNHREFDQADLQFKNYKLTPEGQETIKELENELLDVETGDELLKTEENEKRSGIRLFLHFASYCPKCDQLNWHSWTDYGSVEAYLRVLSHRTCCQTCKHCYLVGDNLSPHQITWWQIGCFLKIISLFAIIWLIIALIGR